jgi:hypothetical protein
VHEGQVARVEPHGHREGDRLGERRAEADDDGRDVQEDRERVCGDGAEHGAAVYD